MTEALGSRAQTQNLATRSSYLDLYGIYFVQHDDAATTEANTPKRNISETSLAM